MNDSTKAWGPKLKGDSLWLGYGNLPGNIQHKILWLHMIQENWAI